MGIRRVEDFFIRPRVSVSVSVSVESMWVLWSRWNWWPLWSSTDCRMTDFRCWTNPQSLQSARLFRPHRLAPNHPTRSAQFAFPRRIHHHRPPQRTRKRPTTRHRRTIHSFSKTSFLRRKCFSPYFPAGKLFRVNAGGSLRKNATIARVFTRGSRTGAGNTVPQCCVH